MAPQLASDLVGTRKALDFPFTAFLNLSGSSAQALFASSTIGFHGKSAKLAERLSECARALDGLDKAGLPAKNPALKAQDRFRRIAQCIAAQGRALAPRRSPITLRPGRLKASPNPGKLTLPLADLANQVGFQLPEQLDPKTCVLEVPGAGPHARAPVRTHDNPPPTVAKHGRLQPQAAQVKFNESECGAAQCGFISKIHDAVLLLFCAWVTRAGMGMGWECVVAAVIGAA